MVQIWAPACSWRETLSAGNNEKRSKRARKTYHVDSMTTVLFRGELLSLYFKNVKYRINILGILTRNLGVNKGISNLPYKFFVY